jgi:hypothetical protein
MRESYHRASLHGMCECVCAMSSYSTVFGHKVFNELLNFDIINTCATRALLLQSSLSSIPSLSIFGVSFAFYIPKTFPVLFPSHSFLLLVSSLPTQVSTLLGAMKDDLHYALAPGRSAKQQALEVIKKLQAIGVPIVRARMQLKVHLTTAVIGRCYRCPLYHRVTLAWRTVGGGGSINTALRPS